MNINEIKPNPNNPRIIKDNKFKQLVKSIQDFPQMLELRPIVIDENNVVLGGNMRLKACIEAGLKDVPVKQAKDLTEEQKKEFIIKDNVGFGEWDWDDLANTWDVDKLEDWGLDMPFFENIEDEKNEEKYTNKIEIPIYEPSNKKPEISQLYDIDKYYELITKIRNLYIISEEEKEFLEFAATRHIIFNYQKIADYYAHSNKDIQELMEKSALIIIDFDKSMENGFVKISEEINKFLDNE